MHRRSSTLALRQAEIVSHADLVPIAENRRAGKRKHQTIGEFDPPAVAVEHWREAAPDSAIIKLHLRLRSEGFEDRLPFLLTQAPQVELIVIA